MGWLASKVRRGTRVRRRESLAKCIRTNTRHEVTHVKEHVAARDVICRRFATLGIGKEVYNVMQKASQTLAPNFIRSIQVAIIHTGYFLAETRDFIAVRNVNCRMICNLHYNNLRCIITVSCPISPIRTEPGI